jgi:hypothetical protein
VFAAGLESQWTGLRVITRRDRDYHWTSDLDCTDASGVPNQWDVKLCRANGQVHYCGHLAERQPVTLDAPDLCLR